jgi:hypothetical protein
MAVLAIENVKLTKFKCPKGHFQRESYALQIYAEGFDLPGSIPVGPEVSSFVRIPEEFPWPYCKGWVDVFRLMLGLYNEGSQEYFDEVLSTHDLLHACLMSNATFKLDGRETPLNLVAIAYRNVAIELIEAGEYLYEDFQETFSMLGVEFLEGELKKEVKTDEL